MENFQKLELRDGNRVKIINYPEGNIFNGETGTVVGIAVDNIISFYIIETDHQHEEWSCVVVPEVCLEKIN